MSAKRGFSVKQILVGSDSNRMMTERKCNKTEHIQFIMDLIGKMKESRINEMVNKKEKIFNFILCSSHNLILETSELTFCLRYTNVVIEYFPKEASR